MNSSVLLESFEAAEPTSETKSLFDPRHQFLNQQICFHRKTQTLQQQQETEAVNRVISPHTYIPKQVVNYTDVEHFKSAAVFSKTLALQEVLQFRYNLTVTIATKGLIGMNVGNCDFDLSSSSKRTFFCGDFMPGAYVLSVLPSSLAESAGILADDVILSVYSGNNEKGMYGLGTNTSNSQGQPIALKFSDITQRVKSGQLPLHLLISRLRSNSEDASRHLKEDVLRVLRAKEAREAVRESTTESPCTSVKPPSKLMHVVSDDVSQRSSSVIQIENEADKPSVFMRKLLDPFAQAIPSKRKRAQDQVEISSDNKRIKKETQIIAKSNVPMEQWVSHSRDILDCIQWNLQHLSGNYLIPRCIENATDDYISSEKDYQKYFSSILKAKYSLLSCFNCFDVATTQLQLMLLGLQQLVNEQIHQFNNLIDNIYGDDWIEDCDSHVKTISHDLECVSSACCWIVDTSHAIGDWKMLKQCHACNSSAYSTEDEINQFSIENLAILVRRGEDLELMKLARKILSSETFPQSIQESSLASFKGLVLDSSDVLLQNFLRHYSSHFYPEKNSHQRKNFISLPRYSENSTRNTRSKQNVAGMKRKRASLKGSESIATDCMLIHQGGTMHWYVQCILDVQHALVTLSRPALEWLSEAETIIENEGCDRTDVLSCNSVHSPTHKTLNRVKDLEITDNKISCYNKPISLTTVKEMQKKVKGRENCSGSALIGKQVYACWTKSSLWYIGTVMKYNECNATYHVLFDDGDEDANLEEIYVISSEEETNGWNGIGPTSKDATRNGASKKPNSIEQIKSCLLKLDRGYLRKFCFDEHKLALQSILKRMQWMPSFLRLESCDRIRERLSHVDDILASYPHIKHLGGIFKSTDSDFIGRIDVMFQKVASQRKKLRRYDLLVAGDALCDMKSIHKVLNEIQQLPFVSPEEEKLLVRKDIISWKLKLTNGFSHLRSRLEEDGNIQASRKPQFEELAGVEEHIRQLSKGNSLSRNLVVTSLCLNEKVDNLIREFAKQDIERLCSDNIAWLKRNIKVGTNWKKQANAVTATMEESGVHIDKLRYLIKTHDDLFIAFPEIYRYLSCRISTVVTCNKDMKDILSRRHYSPTCLNELILLRSRAESVGVIKILPFKTELNCAIQEISSQESHLIITKSFGTEPNHAKLQQKALIERSKYISSNLIPSSIQNIDAVEKNDSVKRAFGNTVQENGAKSTVITWDKRTIDKLLIQKNGLNVSSIFAWYVKFATMLISPESSFDRDITTANGVEFEDKYRKHQSLTKTPLSAKFENIIDDLYSKLSGRLRASSEVLKFAHDSLLTLADSCSTRLILNGKRNLHELETVKKGNPDTILENRVLRFLMPMLKEVICRISPLPRRMPEMRFNLDCMKQQYTKISFNSPELMLLESSYLSNRVSIETIMPSSSKVFCQKVKLNSIEKGNDIMVMNNCNSAHLPRLENAIVPRDNLTEPVTTIAKTAGGTDGCAWEEFSSDLDTNFKENNEGQNKVLQKACAISDIGSTQSCNSLLLPDSIGLDLNGYKADRFAILDCLSARKRIKKSQDCLVGNSINELIHVHQDDDILRVCQIFGTNTVSSGSKSILTSREKFRGILGKSFSKGLDMFMVNESNHLCQSYCTLLGLELEESIFTLSPNNKACKGSEQLSKTYREKVRSLRHNLEDAKNPLLCAQVLARKIAPNNLVSKPVEDLASDSVRKTRENAAAEKWRQAELNDDIVDVQTLPSGRILEKMVDTNDHEEISFDNDEEESKQKKFKDRHVTTVSNPTEIIPNITDPLLEKSYPGDGVSISLSADFLSKVDPPFQLTKLPVIPGMSDKILSPASYIFSPDYNSKNEEVEDLSRITKNCSLEKKPECKSHQAASPNYSVIQEKKSSPSVNLIKTSDGCDQFIFSIGSPKLKFAASLYADSTTKFDLNFFLPQTVFQIGRVSPEALDDFVTKKMTCKCQSKKNWTITTARLSFAYTSENDAKQYKQFYKDYEKKMRLSMFEVQKSEVLLFLITPKFFLSAFKSVILKNTFGNRYTKGSTYALVLTNVRLCKAPNLSKLSDRPT